MPAAESTDVWSPPASRFGILTGLPIGWFDLIMVDPPWRWTARSTKNGYGKSPERHYQTMTLADIAAIPVGQVAADNSALVLWCTWPILLGSGGARAEQRWPASATEQPAAFSVVGKIIDAWGFRYVTGGAWVKTTRNGKVTFGTGYRLRGSTEPFLLAVRGSPEMARSVRNLIPTDPWAPTTESLPALSGERREHSRKPEDAYSWCEALMPKARRLEIFSQTARPGWVGVGDQAGKWSVL